MSKIARKSKDTLKKALHRQLDRLLPQMEAMFAMVDEMEASEGPDHRLHLVLRQMKSSLRDLLPMDDFGGHARGVPADYLTPAQWLGAFAAIPVDGYVTEADLKREALALARPNGPTNDDGVCEVLVEGGRRVRTYFNPQILRLAYLRCPLTPFPDDGKPTEPRPAPTRSRKGAQVLDMQRFREERRTRR